MPKRNKIDTSKLNEVFNVDGFDGTIQIDPEEGVNSYEGELNPFYGKRHTDETKKIIGDIIRHKSATDEKFRQSRINRGEKNGMYGSKRCGELNPFYGRTHSEESKKLQSEKIKEWYRKNENPRKGKKMSEEDKSKIAERNSKEYKLISPEGNIVEIKNLRQFARDNDLSIGCMEQVVAGRNKSHKGWKKYV